MGDGLKGKISGAVSESISGAIADINPAAAAIDLGKKIAVESVKSFAKREQFGAQLESILKNKTDAQNLSHIIEDFSNHAPIDSEKTQEAVLQLLRHGSQSKEIEQELSLLKGVSVGSGTAISEIADLYTKAREQGQLFASDISSLEEKNIPITEALKTHFHATKDEITALIDAGKIGFPELQQAFQGLTTAGGTFYQVADIQGNTLVSKYAQFQGRLDTILANIGESQSGILHFGLDLTNGVLDYFTGRQAPLTNLDKSQIASGTNQETFLESWFPNLYGKNETHQNMAKQQEEVDFYVNNIQEALKVNDLKNALHYSDEISKRITHDKSLLDNPAALEDDLDARSISEVRQDYAASVIGNKAIIKMFKDYNAARKYKAESLANIPKKQANASIPTSGNGKQIVVNSLVNTIIIQSVDGSIPANDLKQKVGQAFLDLINDVNATTKQ